MCGDILSVRRAIVALSAILIFFDLTTLLLYSKVKPLSSAVFVLFTFSNISSIIGAVNASILATAIGYLGYFGWTFYQIFFTATVFTNLLFSNTTGQQISLAVIIVIVTIAIAEILLLIVLCVLNEKLLRELVQKNKKESKLAFRLRWRTLEVSGLSMAIAFVLINVFVFNNAPEYAYIYIFQVAISVLTGASAARRNAGCLMLSGILLIGTLIPTIFGFIFSSSSITWEVYWHGILTLILLIVSLVLQVVLIVLSFLQFAAIGFHPLPSQTLSYMELDAQQILWEKNDL
jgi:hypothetical protein